MLEEYLPYYPDPDLLHTDGGSHFSNAVVKKLTEARGWDHTICTPYAKWAHGVAEGNNKTMKKIMKHLCRDMDVEQNQWPKLLPLVQGAMNRHKYKSRGNMCNKTHHRDKPAHDGIHPAERRESHRHLGQEGVPISGLSSEAPSGEDGNNI